MNRPPGSSSGSLWRELLISRAFFYISLEPSFVRLSKSPVNVTPFRFPSGSPMVRNARFHSLFFYISFRVPSKGSHRERCSISRAVHLSLRVPGKRTPTPACSPTGPLWIGMPVSRAFFYTPPYKNFHLSLQVPGTGPHSMFPQWGLCGERCSSSRASDLFIHLYLSEYPIKELSH